MGGGGTNCTGLVAGLCSAPGANPRGWPWAARCGDSEVIDVVGVVAIWPVTGALGQSVGFRRWGSGGGVQEVGGPPLETTACESSAASDASRSQAELCSNYNSEQITYNPTLTLSTP